MPSKGQLTGARGVYLVAAELTKMGFVASTTSRNAIGADILVTDRKCKRAYSVQVKTNAKTFSFWLLNANSKQLVSDSYVYVLVNIRSRKSGELIEYFVVPSKVVAKKVIVEKKERSTWYSFRYDDAKEYQQKWSIFGSP